jgi:hypothetical protein
VPEKVLIDGVEYKTDVVENAPQKFFQCFTNESSDPTNSYVSTNPWVTGLRSNMSQPLQGGFQITQWPTGFTTDPSNPSIVYRSIGTLGFFAIDSLDNRVVGVTNTHVLIDKEEFANERNLVAEASDPYNVIQQQTSPITGTDIPSAIYEPKNPNDLYRLGYVKRYMPQSDAQVNYVDCSLVALVAGTVTNQSYLVYNPTLYSDPLPFASSLEIDNLLITKPEVYSTGRTTGPKGYQTASFIFNTIYNCTKPYSLAFKITVARSQVNAKLTIYRKDNVTGSYYIHYKKEYPPSDVSINFIPLSQGDKIELYGFCDSGLLVNDVTGFLALTDSSGNLITNDSDVLSCINFNPSALYNMNGGNFTNTYRWSVSSSSWTSVSNTCYLPCSKPPSLPGTTDGQTSTVLLTGGIWFGNKESFACKMRVKRIKSTETVSGRSFSDQIAFEYKIHTAIPDWPCASGDSGSALIANFDGVWKIIGLVFAGNSVEGIACRIDRVADSMKIKAWLGTENPLLSTGTPDIIVTKTTDASAGSVIKTYNGKTYFQCGLTKTSSPLVT